MKNERINICYGIADERGSYSKFAGTSICSVFENTSEPVTVHLIHDNTLTECNIRKFQELAQKYNQEIEFYNVSVRWAYIWDRIRNKLPHLVASRCTIGMFYRLVIGDIMPGADRVIYLDADTLINMDINELWQHEIPESGIAAVPDLFVQEMGDNMISSGVVSREGYFNSGVLFLDMKRVRKVRNLIDKVLNFVIRYNPDYPDQDALNYLFPQSSILPNKYNTFVNMAREKKWPLSSCIYHYANNSLGLDMDNEFNRLYFSFFVKTPWCDEVFLGNFAKNIEFVRFEMIKLANQWAGKRRIVIGLASGRESILDFLDTCNIDVYIPVENLEKKCFAFDKEKDVILLFLNDDGYRSIRGKLSSWGFVENVDFINMPAKLGLENSRTSKFGIFSNS